MKKIMLLLVALGFSMDVSAGSCREVLWPAYVYPSQWIANDIDKILYPGKTTKNEIVVLNPASGPGTTVNTDYAAQLAKIRNDPDTNSPTTSRVRVLGYIATSYGAKPLQDVIAEIAMYNSLYGHNAFDGYFFDEMASSNAYYQYYSNIINAVGPGYYGYRFVVLNPGVYPHEDYISLASSASGPDRIIFITFEGTYANYQNLAVPTAWNNQPKKYSAHLVHATPATSRAYAVTLSDAKRAGYVYFTDDVMPNPWDTLTAYNSAMVTQLKGEPACTAP